MKKIAMYGAALVVGVWLFGATQSNRLINTMYETCVSQNSSSRSYCQCKQSAMKKLANPIFYTLDMKGEGMRIVKESTAECS